jgi:cyclic-di-GMP-binding protein
MPQDSSFDVVSKLELQEVENAINQANKEMQTRFDFKGSISRVDWDKKESKLTFYSDDEHRLKSVNDIVQSKLVKRGISLKSLDYQAIEKAEGSTVRQVVKMKQGIESEKAKEIIRTIKDSKIKVQATIQGDQLRVTGKSKDDLQTVMAMLRNADFGLPLQFTNFR